jgi:glycosyltransferase involved in cell wall biosynthesis
VIVGNDISVLSCVRDLSNGGGGIASVVVSLHEHISKSNQNSKLAYGLPPEVTGDAYFDGAPNGALFSKPPVDFCSSDIVHIHGVWSQFEYKAYRFAKKHKKKLIVSPHGSLMPWAMNQKKIKKKIAWYAYQKNILNNSDLIIVNSKQELDSVQALGIKAPIAVIESGIDLLGYGDEALDEQRKKVILFLSRIYPVKGVPDLLEAWASIPDKNGYQLHICGYGEKHYLQGIENLINSRGIKDSVVLPGPVFGADKWARYKGAKYYILPSYSENFGVAVAEALYSGLPVVTTHNTPWQCLPENNIGWLINNDINELSGIMRQLIGLPESERAQISNNAHKFASEHFLWTDIAAKYMQTYQWVLDGQCPKPSWVC